MKKNYLFKVMKLCILFLTCGFLQLSAAGYAQTVTLKAVNMPFSQVLDAIRKQTNYGVASDETVIRLARPVTIHSDNMKLDEFLTAILADQPVEFTIVEETIFLKEASAKKSRRGSLNSVLAEEQTVQSEISGLVLDPHGNPVAGATINVEGMPSKRTATDENGVFRLTDVPSEINIVITAVGYTPLHLFFSNETVAMQRLQSGEDTGTHLKGVRGGFAVRLLPQVVGVEEVVVTGLFDRQAESFTGASQTIAGSELKKVSSNNVFSAIAAIDPAFRIIPDNAAGGNINQVPEIRMRGENAFPNLSGELSNNPNAPLFILDGFEVSLQRIVDLDMNLINKITLLKDASATALYGSRGANGVMVVTTVLPKPGRVQATVTHDTRFTMPDLSGYNLLNSAEKLDFERRVGIYDGTSPNTQYTRDVLYNARYQNMLRGVNTDWLNLPLQNGVSNATSLYLQGGDASIRYGLTFRADLQSGVMKGQDRNNYSGQVDLNYFLNKIQFRNSLRVFQNHANESPYGSFSQYVGINPYYTPYDDSGFMREGLDDNTTSIIPNPLYNTTLHSINSTRYFGVTNNFSLRYNISSPFYIETNLSLTQQKVAGDEFYSAQDTRFRTVTDINQRGSYTARNEEQFSYESLTTANLNILTGKNMITSALGFNLSSSSTEFYSLTAVGFPYDRLDNLLFAAQYQPGSRPTGDETTVRRVGFIYSGSYTYDNRYVVDASIRRDGSSQYGSDRKFGTFWSTGAAWNIHNESFFRESSIVERLRLRASYGVTGSTNIPAYSAQSRYNLGSSMTYYGELGAIVGNLSNPLLGWQQVYKTNFGADLDLMRGSLNLRADYYIENTDNAVTTITLAPSVGMTSFSENLGKIQNKGFEFSTRYHIINNPQQGVLWSVNVNGFTNTNILKEMSDVLRATNERNESGASTVLPSTRLREGESINTIYGVRSLGVDPVTGSEVYLTLDGVKTFTWNAADQVALGISQPKWNGNFGSNLSLRGIEVNVIFNYQVGGQIYNQTLLQRVEAVDADNNVDRRAYDLGWTQPGDVSRYMRISGSPVNTQLTSRFVQDQDLLALSSLSVGYNFYRTDLIKRLGLRSLQLTAITNEPFQFSTVQIERGTSNPFARTYSLTLRAGF